MRARGAPAEFPTLAGMEQLIQIGGAILILIAFIAAQRERMSPRSIAYLTLNLVGSLVLAVLAFLDSDWGFLLLEGVWAVASTFGLVERLRAGPDLERSQPAPAAAD